MAMMVLGIILVMSIPAVLVSQAAVRRADTLDVLRSGAQGQIEEVRTLAFSDVGTLGGAPAGVVQSDRTVVVNDVQVRLQTTVEWEGVVSGLAMVDSDGDGDADLGDGVAGFTNSGVDYKSVTVVASLVDDPARTYELKTLVSPDDLSSSNTAAAIVNVIRDEPVATPSPPNDYPSTFLVSRTSGWVPTSTGDQEQQLFVNFTNPDQTWDIRLGFLRTDFDDGRWFLSGSPELATGTSFLAETTVTVYRMITLDLDIEDTGGAAVSDASVTISSGSMATTSLVPADMASPGRFVVTQDSSAIPLKWDSYTVQVSAPGKQTKTVTFSAPLGYPTDVVHEETIVLEDAAASDSTVSISVNDGAGWEVGEVAISVNSPTRGIINLTADEDGLASIDLPQNETAVLTLTSDRGFDTTVVNVTPTGATHAANISMNVPAGAKVVHMWSRFTVSHFTFKPRRSGWDAAIRMEPSSQIRVSHVVDNSDSRWTLTSWCDETTKLRERKPRFSRMGNPYLIRVDRRGGC